jgi:F0F1-type ATP synthase membrane subunit b/b'
MDQSARLTGDNFLKRSGKGHLNASLTGSSFYLSQNKVDSYPTLIQMLKSDLLKIQDMISSNSSDIKMYKLLSKTPGLTKKLSEIEESKNINIEKINESAKNIDKINKIYGTKNLQELVSKLFLELTYNEQILKKLNDYFILMKLKLYKDDTYQENLSKIISVQTFMEKAVNIVPISGGLDERIIQLSLEKEKLSKELLELKDKMENNKNTNLENKDNEINKLKKEIELLKKKLEEERENYNNMSMISNTNNTSNIFETEIKFRNSSEFKKILTDFETDLKKSREGFCSKLNEEIKDIKIKFEKLEENFNVINEERKSLKKEVDKMRKGGFDPDSYEAVLRDQFETMKKSFMIKLENLNEELNNVKQESRVKIYQIEEEMKECNYLKNVFLNQLVTLQSKLEINN